MAGTLEGDRWLRGEVDVKNMPGFVFPIMVLLTS